MTDARDPDGRWVYPALVFFATGLVVLTGVCLGHEFLPASRQVDHFRTPRPASPEAALANWDGRWYVQIARDGYSYTPHGMSAVSFFPTFPLAGRWAAQLSGLELELALALVSNVFFFLALVTVYAHGRATQNPGAAYAVLAMALVPTGFFFRMAYSDSLFVFLAALALYGMRRGWPVLACAAVVGLATATRPVGVALVPPLVLVAWWRGGSVTRRVVRVAAAVAVGVSGLVGYAAYQHVRFGDPLAFARSQSELRFRDPPPPVEHAIALLTLEPFRAVYETDGTGYWGNFDATLPWSLSLQFANPLYFAATAALVGFGVWRRWVGGLEAVFVAGVLLIPYVTRGYEMGMGSHARYAAVAFPVYLVVGRILAAVPFLRGVLIPPCVVLLAGYSALFAGMYLFI